LHWCASQIWSLWSIFPVMSKKKCRIESGYS